MEKVAVVSILLEKPEVNQKKFNDIISDHNDIVKGRLGIPMTDANMAVIGLVVQGEESKIGHFIEKIDDVKSTEISYCFSEKEINL